MPKFVFVVFTEPVVGQEDEYNDWYDHQHVPDVVALDGITSARRFELAETEPAQEGHHRYLALYEIEADDVANIPRAIAAAKAAGQMPISPAMDAQKTVSVYYQARQSDASGDGGSGVARV